MPFNLRAQSVSYRDDYISKRHSYYKQNIGAAQKANDFEKWSIKKLYYVSTIGPIEIRDGSKTAANYIDNA